LAQQATSAGGDPLMLIEKGLRPGMDIIGSDFAEGACFLPELVMSAEAMKAALSVLDPLLKSSRQEKQIAGRVVLGTVLGDIHEIGKTLVGTLLTANGFEVMDLGVNVPTERFVEAAGDFKADLVGLSALLTTTMANQRKVIEALDAKGLRGKVRVMIGGAPCNTDWAKQIEADGYGQTASDAVRIARLLMDKQEAL
jgi:corrinoid protein of di/trimethylamine methyltransferase